VGWALEHDPEKWTPVFGKDHAPPNGIDTTAYLAANPDVAAAHANPLIHVLSIGQDEGRLPLGDGVFD
jgi:hypothetical protein